MLTAAVSARASPRCKSDVSMNRSIHCLPLQEYCHYKGCHPRVVIEGEYGEKSVQRAVGADGDHVRILRIQRRAAVGKPMHLDFCNRLPLESFHQDEVTSAQALGQRGELGLRIASQLMQECPPALGSDDDLVGSGLAVPPRILARRIQI